MSYITFASVQCKKQKHAFLLGKDPVIWTVMCINIGKREMSSKWTTGNDFQKSS